MSKDFSLLYFNEQIYNFESNSQLNHIIEIMAERCISMSKYTILKAIHNTTTDDSNFETAVFQ